jgi:hypothetical protein
VSIGKYCRTKTSSGPASEQPSTPRIAWLTLSGVYAHRGVFERNGIYQQLEHCPRNDGQFASMCRTTIVRIAPAVTVSIGTISITRFT